VWLGTSELGRRNTNPTKRMRTRKGKRCLIAILIVFYTKMKNPLEFEGVYVHFVQKND
jgi:hypothetical protein